MISLEIPGFGPLELRHLVCDYNGTLALDGQLLSGVAERVSALAAQLDVHVITADTFGTRSVWWPPCAHDLLIAASPTAGVDDHRSARLAAVAAQLRSGPQWKGPLNE